MTPTQYLTPAKHAARLAAEQLMAMLGKVDPREKAPKDLVSEADLAAQEIIFETLRAACPSFGFLGEEETIQTPEKDWDLLESDKPTWVVDPLDGTMNYLYRLPGFAVSIALTVQGRSVLGVIYDPWLGELYTATRDGGAFLNGDPIRTTACVRLDEALLSASLPPRVTAESIEMQRFVDIAENCRALRRMGSAALNLAYVAAGRLDGYWATTVNAWDIAAGTLIAEEAGASLNGVQRDEFSLREADFCISATQDLQTQILHRIRAIS